MKNIYCIYIALLSIVIFNNACTDFTNSVKNTFNAVDIQPKEGFDLASPAWDSAYLDEAQRLFMELPQFQNKIIYMYNSISFMKHNDDDGRIILKVQNVDNESYIDEYTFKDGKWGTPNPVQIGINDKIDKYLYPLSEFSFATAIKILKTYNEKSLLVEGAKETNHIYANIQNNKIMWRPTTINGSRERYSIEFSATGELIEFIRE